MSGGPIKSWRDSWKRPAVSNANALALHGEGATARVTYCGRRAKGVAAAWSAVTCSDCLAARAADEAVPS